MPDLKTDTMTKRDPNTTWLWGGVVFVIFLLVILTRAIPLFYDFDPWIDEAMLIANFSKVSISEVLDPLPLFEQAAPLGYLVLATELYTRFSDPVDGVIALRIFSAVSFVLGAFLVLKIAKVTQRPGIGALSVFFLCMSAVGTRYSLEIKHYPFEVLSTALMIYAALMWRRSVPGSRYITLILASTFSILFSFTAPIIITAGLLTILLQKDPPDGSWADHIVSDKRLLASATLIYGLFFLYYGMYTVRVTELQFLGYAHLYSSPSLSLSDPSSWVGFYKLISSMTWLYGPGFIWNYVFGVLCITGAVFLYVRAFLLFAFTGFTFLIMISLAVTGLFPVLYMRHILFTLPLVAVLTVSGLFYLIELFCRLCFSRYWEIAALLAVVVLLLPLSMRALQKTDAVRARENVSPLIKTILEDTGGDVPVFVYYGAQPVMRVMTPPQITQIGLVDHKSQVPGWLWAHRNFPKPETSEAYFDFVSETLSELSDVYLVFTHFWPEGRADQGGLDRFRSLATATVGECQDIDTPGRAVLWRCSR